MATTVAGAAIGIGSVHLGYFITDKIFKDRHLNPDSAAPEFHYDPSVKHYAVELLFGYRFVLGAEERKAMDKLPIRGGLAGVQLEIPVMPGIGVCARILEFQTKVMAGMAHMQKRTGFDLCGNIGLSLITDNNFKIKAFGEFNSVSISSREPWINSFIAGFSTGFFW